MKKRNRSFNPKGGQGFNDYFQLEALNVIANLVDVPQNLYGENSSVGKFSDKETAKQAFKEIQSSGDINSESISNPGGGFLDQGAIETLLLSKKILGENGGFNTVTAEKVLKDGGYTIEEKSEEEESEKDVKKLDL